MLTKGRQENSQEVFNWAESVQRNLEEHEGQGDAVAQKGSAGPSPASRTCTKQKEKAFTTPMPGAKSQQKKDEQHCQREEVKAKKAESLKKLVDKREANRAQLWDDNSHVMPFQRQKIKIMAVFLTQPVKPPNLLYITKTVNTPSSHFHGRFIAQKIIKSK